MERVGRMVYAMNEFTLKVPVEEKFYVNMYACGRAYGGPEEGGWFYDYGEFRHHIITVDSRLSAQAIADRISQAIKNGDAWERDVAKLKKHQMGYGPTDGVNPATGEGDDNYLMAGGAWGDEKLVCVVETSPGKDYPQERPYYE